MYEPMKFFVRAGSFILLIGSLFGFRYLYFFLFGARKGGHMQSLLLGTTLMLMGFTVIVVGLLADIIAANRRLNEDTLYNIKKMKLEKKQETVAR